MSRLTKITRRIAETSHDVTQHTPQLGTEFAIEQGVGSSMSANPDPIVRNRWSRTDLASAIGKDSHDADGAAITWPPTAQRC